MLNVRATLRPTRAPGGAMYVVLLCVRKREKKAQGRAASSLSRGHHNLLSSPSFSFTPRPVHPLPTNQRSRHPAIPAQRRPRTATLAEPEAGGGAPSPPPSPPGTPPPTPPTPVKSPREEGSTTALVTGAISVIIGVAYLALVAAMNNRGELLPPPPEAFGP